MHAALDQGRESPIRKVFSKTLPYFNSQVQAALPMEVPLEFGERGVKPPGFSPPGGVNTPRSPAIAKIGRYILAGQLARQSMSCNMRYDSPSSPGRPREMHASRANPRMACA